MGELEEQLSRLAQGFDRIVVNRETLEYLIGKGLRLVEPPKLTLAESVEQLFAKQKKDALERARKLPPAPPMDCPSISSIYQEIVLCIVFGAYGAAITLSSIMVEFALKYAIDAKETGGPEYDSEKWDELEDMTFATAIKRATDNGLLDDEEAKRLRCFKDEIRNPYIHYNLKKITKDGVWQNVQILDVRTGETETKDIPAQESPIIQAQAKPLVDARLVFMVFASATEIVRSLLVRTEGIPPSGSRE